MPRIVPARDNRLVALALTCVMGLAGAAFAQPTAPAASAAGAGAPPSRVTDIAPIADGVWLLPGRFERGRQPDGNSLLLQGRDGLVVVDSGRHAEHTRALLDWARARGLAIKAVINTHWHLDHLGGNLLLREAEPGLRAHASRAVPDAVARRMPQSATELERMRADPATDADTRRMLEIDLALYARRAGLAPDEIVEGPAHEVTIAGRALRIGVERGVSGGDLWVLDRGSGTLAVGDFVTLPVPFFDTACAEEWRAAMGRLEALPFERVVPGHGPMMSRGDFGRYRAALDKLLTCAASDRPAAECSAQWVADLGALLPAAAERAAHGMLRYYLEQRLRAAPAERVRFCGG